MKHLQILNWAVLALAVLVMGVNTFAPLPDWAVRADGAVLLLSLFFTAFQTFQYMKR